MCGARVALKLGSVRRHHAAHAPEATCPAQHPETALHLDCKIALAAALSESAGADAQLRIRQRCGAADVLCDETLTSVWTAGWDAVRVEHRLEDERRPDIVLLRGGEPIAAIEIVASHAVSAEKASALETAGIPWIEVTASEALARPDARRDTEAIPVVRTSDASPWRCRRHATRLRAARVVDVYHPGGSRERFIYRVVEIVGDGGRGIFRLQRGTQEIARVEAPPSREPGAAAGAWPALRVAFAQDVRTLLRGGESRASIADSPMRWALGAVAESITEEAPFDTLARDPTPLATTYPRRWFYARERGEWFLPADMRDVRWDRPTYDAFAAHPASRAGRAAVRERAVPSEYWDGRTTLAGRPNRVMFGALHTRTLVGSVAAVNAAASHDASTSGRRVIAVIEGPASAHDIELGSRLLAEEGADAVWVSSPRDWVPEMAALPWLPAGFDERRRGVVLVDGTGVFRAEAFARLLARGDRRLTAAAIRRAMEDRVQRFLAGQAAEG